MVMKTKLFILIAIALLPMITIKAQESASNYSYTPNWENMDIPAFELPRNNSLSIYLQQDMKFECDTLFNYRCVTDFKFNKPIYPIENPYNLHGNIYSHDFKQEGAITSWGNGNIFGFSSYATYPTLGNVGAGGVGVSHNFTEKLNFTGKVSFNKYTLPRNVYNSYAFSGEFTYKFNDNLSITAYGGYESNNFFNNNIYFRHNYGKNIGGYLTAMTDNNLWGVDVGARSDYNQQEGKWTTMPMIRPFYNLNGTKLGFDLGFILYQVFRTTGYINENGGGKNTQNISNPSSSRGSSSPNSKKFLFPRKK